MALRGLFFIILVIRFLTLSVKGVPVPVKFMCDMCENDWISCLIKCNMEEYMTRHKYRNHVYMGDGSVKPRKTQLDKMFEKIMHSTGHDNM